MDLRPVTLRGRHVVLAPLRVEDAEALAAAIAPDDDVWAQTADAPHGAAQMRAWVAARLAPRPGLANLAFVQRHAQTGAPMGSTSLFDVDDAAESAEIGHTWLAAPFRRTGANAEAKLLLLAHAFETLGLKRVQLVTDVRNARSQRAMERLGLVREGVLRNVRRRQDGSLRDSVVYSVVDRDWLDMAARVRALLAGQPAIGEGSV